MSDEKQLYVDAVSNQERQQQILKQEVEEEQEEAKQIKQIEESVKRLRQQRFLVEQLKQDSLAKDTKIEQLHAELLLERQERQRMPSLNSLSSSTNANTHSAPPSPNMNDVTVEDNILLTSSTSPPTTPNDNNTDTSNNANANNTQTNRYVGVPKLIARFRQEVQTLQQEKRVLNEQVKLLKRQQEAAQHEYHKTIETHKELELSLRREIELSESERKAEGKIYSEKLQELEKQFAESRIAALNVEREKEQIGDDLKSAILSMEDAQNAQQLRAEQLEKQVTKLTYHKQDSDAKLKEVLKSSNEYIEIVHKLEMDKNNLVKENATIKTLNEDLKSKINRASKTIDFSNSEMEKQRILMTDVMEELNKEKQQRQHAETLMEESEQEIRALRAELDSSHRTLGELRVLGEVLQVRTREVEDREAKSRKELLGRISHLQNALESERENRKQWSNARVQLLQEFCQEEGKLREVIISGNDLADNTNSNGNNIMYFHDDNGNFNNLDDDFDYFNVNNSTPKKYDLDNTINTPSPTRQYPNNLGNNNAHNKSSNDGSGTTGISNNNINVSYANSMQMAQTSASVLTALGKAHVRNTIRGGGGGGDLKFRNNFNTMRKGGGGR